MAKNSMKPQIRFKGFTDAWEQRKLGSVSSAQWCTGQMKCQILTGYLVSNMKTSRRDKAR